MKAGRRAIRPRTTGPGGERPDGVITELAARQHGVVTRQQLIAAGVAPDVVDRRLKADRLRAVHRGVYLVGPVVAPLAREMAACLACGPSAVLSHWSAAALWKLPGASRSPTVVEVTVRGNARRRAGIRTRRIRTLHDAEVTRIEGIPTTTPERTLYDLAASAAPREVERALAGALAEGLTEPARIAKLLGRHPGRPGSPALRAVLDAGRPALTRSEAEERFLALVRRAQLDPPEANVDVAGYEVDFLWRAERLVAEIDGFAYHSSRAAFERDRRRDAVLAAAGLNVVRVTWGQLVDEPEAVLARLVRALALAATRGRTIV